MFISCVWFVFNSIYYYCQTLKRLFSMSKQDEVSDGQEKPFLMRDELSDLVLVVEKKKLYLHKMYLALHSPVFKSMFYSDFQERTAKEIELPGKKCADFVEFLLQLYPVYSLQPITDKNIRPVLLLADEYRVEHLIEKCRQFISGKVQKPSVLTMDQLLNYLCLCDLCCLQAEKALLEKNASDRTLDEITGSVWYYEVDGCLMRDVLASACQKIQTKYLNQLQKDVKRAFNPSRF